jgi:hypothetical protein
MTKVEETRAASPPQSKHANISDVEPYAYLKATFEEIAIGYPAARIDELIPGISQTV